MAEAIERIRVCRDHIDSITTNQCPGSGFPCRGVCADPLIVGSHVGHGSVLGKGQTRKHRSEPLSHLVATSPIAAPAETARTSHNGVRKTASYQFPRSPIYTHVARNLPHLPLALWVDPNDPKRSPARCRDVDITSRHSARLGIA